MKKIFLIISTLVLSISMISCGQKGKENNLKLGLVIDVSGIDDKSFNQSAWEAVTKYAEEYHLPKKNYSYTHSMTPKDYISNLSMYSDQRLDLIIAPGYYFVEPLEVVAKKYPEQKFLLLDGQLEMNNVASITFAANEGSFLVGVAAGLKAQEAGYDTLGFLGGLDIPTVQEFEAGFIQGVHSIKPDTKILIEYAQEFSNPLAGKELANKMYDNGAKIIFNVAGGTGNGLIDVAKERAEKGEDVWVIGVDKDQYEEGLYTDTQSVILTSMLKKIDIAAYDTIVSVANNTFEGNHKLYSLKDNGVGLPDNNPNLKNEWIEQIDKYRNSIIEEKIIVDTIPERIKKQAD